MCPKCKRVYPNTGPDLYHPLTEEEEKARQDKRWKCEKCGSMSRAYESWGGVSSRCQWCGARRPGDLLSWHKF